MTEIMFGLGFFMLLGDLGRCLAQSLTVLLEFFRFGAKMDKWRLYVWSGWLTQARLYNVYCRYSFRLFRLFRFTG